MFPGNKALSSIVEVAIKSTARIFFHGTFSNYYQAFLELQEIKFFELLGLLGCFQSSVDSQGQDWNNFSTAGTVGRRNNGKQVQHVRIIPIKFLWSVHSSTSFLEDWLTVGNDKLPGKVHAVEVGFSKTHFWHQRDYCTKALHCRSKRSKLLFEDHIHLKVCSCQNIKRAFDGQTINFWGLSLSTFLS